MIETAQREMALGFACPPRRCVPPSYFFARAAGAYSWAFLHSTRAYVEAAGAFVAGGSTSGVFTAGASVVGTFATRHIEQATGWTSGSVSVGSWVPGAEAVQ